MICDLSHGRFILLNDYIDLAHASRTGMMRFLQNPDNIGNIVFLDAINRLLPGMYNVATSEFVANRIQYKGYTVVLALANFLSSSWIAPTNFFDALQSHRFVLLSVGLHSELGQEGELELSPDASKLLELARLSGSVIGARGLMTKHFLETQGVDCQVIGCPSVHIIGHWQNRRHQSYKPRICFNNTMQGIYRKTAQQVNRLAMLYGSGYIYQSEEGLIAEYLNLPVEVTDFIAQEAQNPQHARLLRDRYFSCGYYNIDANKWEDLLRWFRSNGRFFTKCQPWSKYASEFDYCFGTRFHGNAVALQSDSQAIFINIDLRVKEMTDFHRLPSISVDSLPEIESINQLVEAFDMSEYNDQFDKNFKSWCDFVTLHFCSRG